MARARRHTPAREGGSTASPSPSITPITSESSAIAEANAAAKAHAFTHAWALLRDLPPQTWATDAADAYARAGLTVEPETALPAIRALAESESASVSSAAWLALCSRVFGYGDQELARVLWNRLDRSVGDGDGVKRFVVESRDWLGPWVATDNGSPEAPAVPAGTVSYAVLDYGHPGRARGSANIGDHVQTIASLGHLLRHRDLTFTGESSLVDLLGRLGERVRPELARTGIAGQVQVRTVHRDATTYQEIPPDTWVLAFGWYMHAIFEMRHDFPFHANLRPLFVSFHCNQHEMLTPEAVDYLRDYGPIGCRDWSTVDILLSAGVPAFFSGCLTTTVNTLFPESAAPAPEDSPAAHVDVAPSTVPIGSPLYRQAADVVRFRPFVRNMDDAVAMLDHYRTRYRRLVTSRLHAYLPSRSIGLEVDFRPHNVANPRFVGLSPLTDEGFESIRTGITELLDQVLSKALAGAPPAEVYQRWRELTAPLVDQARARLDAEPDAADPRSTIAAQVRSRAVAVPAGVPDDATHVVLAMRRGERPLLRRLVASIAAHASGPVHVWVLHNGRKPRVAALARPSVTLSDVDVSDVGRDLFGGAAGRYDVAELARLIAADLLVDVPKLVLLPLDAVVTDDVSRLAGVDLAGEVVAAPTTVDMRPGSGFRVIHAAARRLGELNLPDAADRAAELRRSTHRRHDLGFDAFETEVLVVDAAAARDQGLLQRLVVWMERFDLNHRSAMHAELGAQRGVVPDRWHNRPRRSAVREPALVRPGTA